MTTPIVHEGIIRQVSGGKVSVAITAEQSCGGCSAKQICGLSESSEKIIDVDCSSINHQVGDKVNVVMKSSIGTKAVLTAYVIPLFFFIVALLICSRFTNELIASGIAVIVLVSYFVILHKKKHIIEKHISFSIQKI